MSEKEKIPTRGMLLVLIGWTAIFIGYFGNFSLGLMLPSMCEELGLDVAILGGNLSSLGFMIKVFVTLPFALWATRTNPKYFLGIIYTLLGGSLLLHGLAKDVTWLYVGRIIMQGCSAGITGALALVKTNWIPSSRMSQINGYENAIGTAGQMVALSFTVPLIALLGSWRSTLAVFGGLGILVGVLWFVFFKENDAVGKIIPAQKKPFLEPLKQALKYRSVWLMSIGWPGTTLVWIAITTFWPTYAVESLGLDLKMAGALIGLIPIASMVASLTSPKLTELIGVDKLMMWPWGLILPVAYFIPLVVKNPIIIAICFIVAGYGAFAFVPIAMTHIYKLPGIDPSAISVGISVILTLTSVGGMLAGMVVKALYASMGLFGSMAICCLSPLLWFITSLFLPEYGRKAMEKKAAKAQQ